MYWSNVRLILEDTLNNSCYRIRVRVITSHYMISVRTRGILCSLDSSLITTKRFTTLPTRTYRLRMSRVDEQLDPLTMLVLESQLKATWSCNFFLLGIWLNRLLKLFWLQLRTLWRVTTEEIDELSVLNRSLQERTKSLI